MPSEHSRPAIAAGDHKAYMEYTLEQARHSSPAPTRFCVGSVLVDADRNEIMSTGYSMELPGDGPGDQGTYLQSGVVSSKWLKNTVSQMIG
jgi:hypothetical protein